MKKRNLVPGIEDIKELGAKILITEYRNTYTQLTLIC